MEKRAALALRTVAVLELVSVVRMLIMAVLRERTLAELHAGKRTSQEVFAELARWSSLSLWGHVLLIVLCIVAVLVFAFSLTRGRGVALASGALLLSHLALSAVGRAAEPTLELPTWLELVWWSDGVCLTVGFALPLLAVERATRVRLARVAVLVAGFIALSDAALSAYGALAQRYPPGLAWIERTLAVAAAAWFAALAFPLAKRLAAGQSSEIEAKRAVDAGPLRMLGWALLARIGTGIALQVPLTMSMVNGDFDGAGTFTTLGVFLGVLVSVVILVALAQYQRFPETHRGESLVFAMGLLVVGVALEIYVAVCANKLFALASQAKRASSFWSMPSLSEIETLQATMVWGGRLGLLVGVGAGLALVSSLRTTARAVGGGEHLPRANFTMGLLLAAGAGAIVTGLLMESMKRSAAPLLLGLALVLLIVAIALLVNWLKLLFGLANELERQAAES